MQIDDNLQQVLATADDFIVSLFVGRGVYLKRRVSSIEAALDHGERLVKGAREAGEWYGQKPMIYALQGERQFFIPQKFYPGKDNDMTEARAKISDGPKGLDKAIQQSASKLIKERAKKAPAKAKAKTPAKKASKAKAAKTTKTPAKKAPAKTNDGPTKGSKAEVVLKLASRPKGVTTPEILEATGWRNVAAKRYMDHPERGLTRHGYKLQVIKRDDGTTAYHLRAA